MKFVAPTYVDKEELEEIDKLRVEEVRKKLQASTPTLTEAVKKTQKTIKEAREKLESGHIPNPEIELDPIFGILKPKSTTTEVASKLHTKKTPTPPKKKFGIIVPKDPEEEKEEFKRWLATTPGFIEGLTMTDVGRGPEPTHLYDYQDAFMLDPSRNRYINKSRQTGFSYVFASEGLAKAMLKTKHTSIFVSYNDEEAKEKIEYARALYESMPLKWQMRRPLVTDNKSRLEFKTKIGKTRLMSHGQRPPRGKGGGVDVYLDELAHYMFAKAIYVAAGPIISRSGGVLTVGSTPLGKGDVFWEIGYSTDNAGKLQYPNFSRIHVHWWDCPEFCIDVDRARVEAPAMHTDERVELFGSDTLKVQRFMQDMESFQQEFELAFIDETISFFPYDLIKACQHPTLRYYSDLNEFVKAIEDGEVNFNLYAGFDVGRVKDKSEFYIIEEIDGVQYTRYGETLTRMNFSDQKDYLRWMMNNLPIHRLGIDKTGMGINIAEDMEREYPSRVEGVNFSNEFKEKCANNLKLRMEQRSIWIPLNKELSQQIHAIKKSVSATGHIRYDVEKNKDHHGDKFWALGLGSLMGTEATGQVCVIPGTKVNPDAIVRSQRAFAQSPESEVSKLTVNDFGPMVFGGEGNRLFIPSDI